jgi:aminopeptidase N
MDERVRYYFALAAALDPALAERTLALTLTDELPANIRSSLISSVAWSGGHGSLALDFVRTNFSRLAAEHGDGFRNNFVSNLMAFFSDPVRAAELAAFAPAHATSGGRMVASRAQASILADAAFIERRLGAVAEWLALRRP